MHGRRRRIILLVFALAVLVSLAASVSARPPPQPLCEVCSDEVVPDSAVEASEVTIEIDDAGTGHWVVRIDLEEAVAPDETRLQRAARESLRGHHAEPAPRNLSVEASTGTAVITYEIPQMGHRFVSDVLVVDYFYSHGDEAHWYGVNADRVVVRGPNDTTLTRAPAEVRANESAIVLTGEHGDVFERTISRGWHLAFAGGDGVGSAVWSTMGIGSDIAAAKLDGIGGATWLPVAILVSVLAVLYREGPSLAEKSHLQRLRFGLALTAALAVGSVTVELALGSTGVLLERLEDAVFSLVFGAVLTSALLLAVLFAGVVQSVLLAPRLDVDVPLAAIRDGGVTASVVILLGSVLAAGTAMGATTAYGSIVGVLTPLLFLPLGLTARRRYRVLLGSTIVVAPILLGLGFGPFSQFTRMYYPLLYVPWALLSGVVGTVGYAFGRSHRIGHST